MLRAVFIQFIVLFLAWAVGWGFCWEDEFGPNFYDIKERLEKLQIYFETEMYEEAATLLEELSSQYPQEPKFKYLRAIIDYQRGDYDCAGRIFDKFIQDYPDVAEPYYLLGEINLKKGKQDLARQYLRKYCELVPQDIEAQHKLNSILNNIDSNGANIIKDGKENLNLVERIGFYGACVHSQQDESIRLINGSSRTWSSMGIDFAYPLDLRGKQIVLKLKGKQGGERLELILRDKFAKDYNPQLVLTPQGELKRQWQKLKVSLDEHQTKIDLSCVVHMGLEFGFATVQNPPNTTLFVKDVVIINDHN